MSCTSPLTAHRASSGDVVFHHMAKHGDAHTLLLPCGQCVSCRLTRSNHWAARVMHEASLYENNCFVTLTYDDAHLPASNSLDHRDFQLFLKRLRKLTTPISKVRYYMCGEYGTKTQRPHFHACLFNVNFKHDQIWHSKSDAGSFSYSSPSLTKLWPLGQSTVGDLTWQSAAYTARYVMQKITGSLADSHYNGRTPEYNRMSLKPGIGAGWYQRFHQDVDAFDYLVSEGVKTSVPSYYHKLLKRRDDARYAEKTDDRQVAAVPHVKDRSVERLAVHEAVAKARLLQLKRNLE